MKKTKIIVALLLVAMMLLTVGLSACKSHTCSNKCEECGRCTDTNCTERACRNKCKGHAVKPAEDPNHACTSKCPICNKCFNTTCTEGVNCKDKCAGHPIDELLPYKSGTTLRIAAGYQKTNEAISFQDSSIVGDSLTLANGKTYVLGDLKPTWQQVSTTLNINFVDKFSGAGSATKEFQKWEKEGLDQVDIVAGSASGLQEAGAKGEVIDIAQYLGRMPNFRNYLYQNEIVQLSITGDAATGAMYFSPYFDGVDDIERYPLIRADFVIALLDGNTAYAGANRALKAVKYQPYMPTEGSVVVESLDATGKTTQEIKKDYSKTQNIIAQMNAKTDLKGDEAVAMFRKYIDDMYGTTYTNRSDLFLGYNAAWDADELVALLRCAVASLNDNNGDAIQGMFSRETSNTQREVDLFRFAGSLFGVRGMESRQDYLYFDRNGNLHDARGEEASYAAMERMHAMYQEGLIVMEGTSSSDARLETDGGLVSYDYSQTQTVYNDTKLNGAGKDNTNTGEKYTPMMVPVARWFDGTKSEGVYMRFTESWRSVKTDGWALSKAGIGDDQDKLFAALRLIDFAFSIQGQITMSYGSDDFIKVKDASVVIETWADVAKKYETFDFNGQAWPVVTDAMYAELQSRTGGNYTNYARRYLGSTLNGFPKSQAFEYQCTHVIGREGAAKVSAAIALGTVKHPVLAINWENMWYTSIPTTLPTNATENETINGYTNLSSSTNFSSSSGGNNIFLNIIKNGWTIDEFDGVTSAAQAAALVNTWGSPQYVAIKQAAWSRLIGLSKD